MSKADAVTGGRKPVVKGSMGVDDIDIDDDVRFSFTLSVCQWCILQARRWGHSGLHFYGFGLRTYVLGIDETGLGLELKVKAWSFKARPWKLHWK